MASKEIEARRTAWREQFDPRRPLIDQLDAQYAPAWQIAHVMGVSESTVYTHGICFDALMRSGDRAAASRYVPCIVSGRSKRFPAQAFIQWWESAGGTTMRLLMADEAKESIA